MNRGRSEEREGGKGGWRGRSEDREGVKRKVWWGLNPKHSPGQSCQFSARQDKSPNGFSHPHQHTTTAVVVLHSTCGCVL